jgi:uncharacterized membrane protein
MKKTESVTTEECLDGLVIEDSDQLEEENQVTSVKAIVFSEGHLWYWSTVALVGLMLVIAFPLSGNSYISAYVRPTVGVVFVLYLPGYAFMKMLYASDTYGELNEKIDSISRMGLDIGASLAFVPIVALILNFTPWGINLTSIICSLSVLTIAAATAALVKECTTKLSTAAHLVG